MKVPFVDLALQYQNLKPEIDRAISEVLSSGHFIGGKTVSDFEQNFAQRCGVKHCIALSNGTNGLFLALKALGIGPGDEVITPAWSWISTAEVISLCGAVPVFADVDENIFTLTVHTIQKKITSRTKAIILVHLYGQMADARAVQAVCKQHNLFLLEDCSQAHFSSGLKQYAGTVGDCGVFSLYPTKNLGAFGDAGCVITHSDVLADLIRRWANHGGLTKDDHLMEGFNSRMDALQAAILNVKLNYINAWNQQRIRHAGIYMDELANLRSISLPRVRENTTHTFHQFVIKVSDRDHLKQYLAERDVHTMIHYPKALPFEPAYSYLNSTPDDFPVSATLQECVLSLPVVPELKEDQVLEVCKHIKAFYGA
jgi:dTDP-4-amino-4,6-dideoxygalactose transaminase